MTRLLGVSHSTLYLEPDPDPRSDPGALALSVHSAPRPRGFTTRLVESADSPVITAVVQAEPHVIGIRALAVGLTVADG
ncbi:hypothetical protein [Actinokineospora globicatena]|uniref:Uncharacterized protein n=1 Tax=Actinokineospora globicatena TaxID=103729 RepID=A0A9W6QSR3_9PSEU|nr:hypothetical protein [Actinokineospora globicatena]GLW94887.1 hypothetical protein Aglo03_57030 [Actinokineospora globicatena]